VQLLIQPFQFRQIGLIPSVQYPHCIDHYTPGLCFMKAKNLPTAGSISDVTLEIVLAFDGIVDKRVR